MTALMHAPFQHRYLVFFFRNSVATFGRWQEVPSCMKILQPWTCICSFSFFLSNSGGGGETFLRAHIHWRFRHAHHETKNRLSTYLRSEMWLRGKSLRSWCDGSSDRSFMGWTHWAISRSSQCSTTGNKGRGMYYPVCGMVHIKEPLLLIEKSSPCGGRGFPLSLSEWSFTICPVPYNRKIKCVECVVK